MEPPERFLAREPAAVDHAFAVLETVAELGPGATTAQLVSALPMSRGTVYRLVKHLVDRGYLARTPDQAALVLGPRVVALTASLR